MPCRPERSEDPHRPGRELSVGKMKIPRLTARDDKTPQARDDKTPQARDDKILQARDDNGSLPNDFNS